MNTPRVADREGVAGRDDALPYQYGGDTHVHEPSPQARSKAAAYATRPSVTAATPAAAVRPGWVRRLVAAARTAVTAAVLLAGPPVLLWWLFGDPTRLGPSRQQLRAWSTGIGGVPTDLLRAAGIWLLWLLWAAIGVALLGSLTSVLAGRRLPRWRLPAPLHRIIVGLAGGAAVGVVTAAHPGSAVVAQAFAAQPGTLDVPPVNAGMERGPVLVQVGDREYEYLVVRGDTMSKIARQWLGDPDRWPEICGLNKHHHQAGGGRLTDCDLIYPGWRLRLPADASPPPGDTPVARRHTTDSLRPGPRPEPPEHPAASAVPSSPAEDATTASPTQGRDVSAPAGRDTPSSGAASDDGITLPGGTAIPWTLAGAITGAAAMVWLQRRRRYRPGTSQPLPPLPARVRAIQTAVQRHTAALPPGTRDTPGEPVRLPAGGTGLAGPGAQGAARAMLVAALTAGSPDDPDQRAEVIIDQPTLTELLPGRQGQIAPWPRLHVPADLDGALTLLDTRLLQRARILDEHSLTDLDTLRRHAYDEEALPPLLLITRAEPAAGLMRARITLGLTAGLDVNTVLLGTWSNGATVSVTADGHTTTDQPANGIEARLPVLDLDTALGVLAVVREAHTGEPPAPAAAPTSQADRVPSENAQPPTPPPPEASDRDAHAVARLHVLGPPRVENVRYPGRALRSKAAELAVYLACHPDGADTDTIADQLLPDARMRQSKQQVHTNASNLRHVLARAGGPLPGGYLTKRGPHARYRLDPTTVHIDLWQFHDLLRQARHATPPERTRLLRQACDLAGAPLADGCDYEWVEPHRHRTRQQAVEAHTLLAADLLPTDPDAAAAVLDTAIRLDPYNEDLYRQAMRTRHALGDADGIRTLLHALARALNRLDAEPADDTTHLAHQLITDLTTKP